MRLGRRVPAGQKMLDYATERPAAWSARLADLALILLVVACATAAAVCGVVTLGHLKAVQLTPEFKQYLVLRSRSETSTQPFVGRQFVPQPSVWHYPSTYGAAAFAAAAVAFLAYGLRPRVVRPAA